MAAAPYWGGSHPELWALGVEMVNHTGEWGIGEDLLVMDRVGGWGRW